MNNSPSGMKKVPIRIISLMVGGLVYLLVKLDIDINSVMSTIALLLFISVMGYYLLPKTHARRQRTAVPKHKQYDDSNLTDRMMEKIMKAYNVKEKTDDADEEFEEDNGFNESTEKNFSSKKFGEKSSHVINKVVEEEIREEDSKEVEEEVDEEIDVVVKHKQYNDSRLTDYVMEKIMKAYNVKEETDDTDDEDEEFEEEDEEEDEEEADEEVENSPIFYGNETGTIESKPQFAIYNFNDNEDENKGIKALFSPAQLPLVISGLWFIIAVIIYNFFPDIRQSIPKAISPLIFTVLPILFLVGLSGLLGILLKQPSENLETTPKEKMAYILNILKILAGWGAAIYVFIINF